MILLPSYTIIEVGVKEASKPFAFAATHSSARNYILAAENEEQMTQWIEKLTNSAKI